MPRVELVPPEAPELEAHLINEAVSAYQGDRRPVPELCEVQWEFPDWLYPGLWGWVYLSDSDGFIEAIQFEVDE